MSSAAVVIGALRVKFILLQSTFRNISLYIETLWVRIAASIAIYASLAIIISVKVDRFSPSEQRPKPCKSLIFNLVMQIVLEATS